MGSNAQTMGCNFLPTSFTCFNTSQYTNTTMQTVGTGYGINNPSYFLFGMNMIITDYDPAGAFGINFDLTGTAVSGDTYKGTFSYTGSATKQFMVRYTYLIIL